MEVTVGGAHGGCHYGDEDERSEDRADRAQQFRHVVVEYDDEDLVELVRRKADFWVGQECPCSVGSVGAHFVDDRIQDLATEAD